MSNLSFDTSDTKEDKIFSLDKICESNNDCRDNEYCDPQIGICICSNGFQLDDTKKFCLSMSGNIGLGLNTSGYDIDEVGNPVSDRQQQLQQQIDTFKKVNRKMITLIMS